MYNLFFFKQKTAYEMRISDWSSDVCSSDLGAPLPYAAGVGMFDFIARDVPGSGQWRVAGKAIDPAALACPAVDFVSLTDRIVPAASAADLPDRRDLSAGPVGMIVGSRARTHLWEPIAAWRTSVRNPGGETVLVGPDGGYLTHDFTV